MQALAEEGHQANQAVVLYQHAVVGVDVAHGTVP
jgi:hypothetical protein